MDSPRHLPHEMTPVAALAQAQRLEREVRTRTRWYGRFLIAFGTGVLVITPLWGLVTSGLASVVLNLVWVAFLICTALYVRRQPVAGHGMSGRYLWVILTWVLISAAVLVPGFLVFAHNPAWWIPGGLAASAPFFISAYREHHR